MTPLPQAVKDAIDARIEDAIDFSFFDIHVYPTVGAVRIVYGYWEDSEDGYATFTYDEDDEEDVILIPVDHPEEVARLAEVYIRQCKDEGLEAE